jgi:hypothetical protein
MTRTLLTVLPLALALYLPFCASEVTPVLAPETAPPASLWIDPAGMGDRDLFFGPWGPERAPDAAARYTLVERKHSGVNPGMTVRDPGGREWSVKQPPLEGNAEGPVEIVLSRVLSALGYHQPPVYYLSSFTLVDDWGTRREPGGRFRLKDKALKDRGEWSWQQNPFVGTRSYQGLLVVLMTFNSTDLKNSNNTLYEYRGTEQREHWYVVRDIGSALGGSGRFAPRRGDAATFARLPLLKGVRDGFVEFNYRGYHQELVRRRITPEDVAWAAALMNRLTDEQWLEAFRAGGYTPGQAAPFISTLQGRIAEGLRLPQETATSSISTQGN